MGIRDWGLGLHKSLGHARRAFTRWELTRLAQVSAGLMKNCVQGNKAPPKCVEIFPPQESSLTNPQSPINPITLRVRQSPTAGNPFGYASCCEFGLTVRLSAHGEALLQQVVVTACSGDSPNQRLWWGHSGRDMVKKGAKVYNFFYFERKSQNIFFLLKYGNC
ncbi:hypothetical protein SD81_004950 [Tolypothrix campylonemoides VB511288]|nr:hypothetical protein SD81_004950 [Tolypothrix campylonemoides VB511288]